MRVHTHTQALFTHTLSSLPPPPPACWTALTTTTSCVVLRICPMLNSTGPLRKWQTVWRGMPLQCFGSDQRYTMHTSTTQSGLGGLGMKLKLHPDSQHCPCECTAPSGQTDMQQLTHHTTYIQYLITAKV